MNGETVCSAALVASLRELRADCEFRRAELWQREDGDIIARVSLAEAERITGRTFTAVRKRRRALGLPDGRMAVQRASKLEATLVEQVSTAGRNLRLGVSQHTTALAELRQTFDQHQSTIAFWRS